MPFTDPSRLSDAENVGLAYLPNRGILRSAALTAAQVGNVLPVAETAGRPNRGACPPGTEGVMNSGFRDFNLDIRTASGKPSDAEIIALMAFYKVGDRTVRRWFNMPDEHGRQEPRNFVPVASVGKSIDALRDRTQDTTLTQKQRDNAERALRRIYLAAPLVVYGGAQQTPIYSKGGRLGDPYVTRSQETNLSGCARTVRQVFNEVIRLDDINLGRAWVQLEIVPMEWGWDVVCLFFYPRESETP